MKRLLLALAMLLTAAAPPARAASARAISACTLTSSTLSQGVLDSVPPAGTLCLTAGSYAPGLMVLRGDGSPRTVSAVPGTVIWHGVVVIQSPRWTVAGLILDAAGQDLAAVTINTIASGVTLTGNDIRNGSYYGVDVWGSTPTIRDNTIHNFQPPNQVPGNDDQCVNVHPVSSGGVLQGNTIFDCWGDGIQIYGVLPTPVTQSVSANWQIVGNTFYRGTLAYSENGIDVKQGSGLLITGNDLSGYSNAGHLGTGQPAVVFHGVVTNATFIGNSVHDSYQGIQLSNGQWTGLAITGNSFRNLVDYTLEVAAGRQVTVRGNTITNGGAEVFQVASNGWSGGALDHNVIQSSGAPRLYAGATWANVTVGPNAWVGSTPGFLAGLGDVGGIALGFGVPATATATATPSALPTITDTPTSSPTPAATDTAQPSATAQPSSTPTATQLPTPACLTIAGGELCFVPFTATP